MIVQLLESKETNMAQEIEYKSYVIRLEEHPKVYVARIYEDLTEPSLPHIERGSRLHGAHRVIAAAKRHIEKLEIERASIKRDNNPG